MKKIFFYLMISFLLLNSSYSEYKSPYSKQELLKMWKSKTESEDKTGKKYSSEGSNESKTAAQKKLDKPIAKKIHPTELWNGFTDEMTVTQVKARADKLLNAKSTELYKQAMEYDGAHHISYNIVDTLPHPDTVIFYESPNKEFEQKSWGNAESNVWFWFYKNRLYGVEIYWNIDIKDAVIEKAKENYGNDYTIKEDSHSSNWIFSTDIAHIWKTEQKDIYLTNIDSTASSREQLQLFVFSKELLNQYEIDLKAKEERIRTEREEYLKSTSNRIKF